MVGQYDLADYFPLTQGSEWIYQSYEQSKPDDKENEKIVIGTTQSINGVEATKMKWYYSNKQNDTYVLDDYSLFSH